MSRTWNHTIRPIVGSQKARVTFHETQSWNPDAPVTDLFECASCPVKAKKLATWVASYEYITGRGGRTSTAQRRLCDEHAKKYCLAHGTEPLEAEPEDPRSRAYHAGEFGQI